LVASLAVPGEQKEKGLRSARFFWRCERAKKMQVARCQKSISKIFSLASLAST
jgi:hypothetical protein